ncbi:MAG: NPCBM/NEW2 domain-containing protein, partial [Thermoguttaceae bacterium]
GLRALVGLGDGALLVANSLILTEETAKAELTLGVPIEWDAPGDIVSLRPLGGQVTYLSDVDERRYRHVPYLDLAWPFHKDRNVLGGRLRAGGRLFHKGLGMHSSARLTYRLDGPYRRFEAELAIDDAAGRQGSVIFRLFTTDGKTWQEAFTSPIVRGGTEPLPMSVDLQGTQAIALVVDFADRSDQQDHADWLSARLIK